MTDYTSLINAGLALATTIISILNNRIGRRTHTDMKQMSKTNDEFRSTLKMAVGEEKYGQWLAAQQRVQEGEDDHPEH